MRTLLWVTLLALAGCATRENRVDCAGKLQPINVPAPKGAP